MRTKIRPISTAEPREDSRPIITPFRASGDDWLGAMVLRVGKRLVKGIDTIGCCSILFKKKKKKVKSGDCQVVPGDSRSEGGVRAVTQSFERDSLRRR